jgi:hypothetical protein
VSPSLKCACQKPGGVSTEPPHAEEAAHGQIVRAEVGSVSRGIDFSNSQPDQRGLPDGAWEAVFIHQSSADVLRILRSFQRGEGWRRCEPILAS